MVMLKITERLTGYLQLFRVLAEGIAWGALASLGVMAVILVCSALRSAHAAEPPARGLVCTYTTQSAPTNGDARTYGVQVLGPFDMAPEWLWVKRVGAQRFQAFLATPADLSECRK